jgi:hypothetical protein
MSNHVLSLNKLPPLGCDIEHVFNADTGEIVGAQDAQSGTRIIFDGANVHLVCGAYRVMHPDNFNALVDTVKCLMPTTN